MTSAPSYIQQSESIMVDVGLKGNEEKILVNSYAIFSGLKFKTTSYNHEGAPFYLIITIYYGSINDYHKTITAAASGDSANNSGGTTGARGNQPQSQIGNAGGSGNVSDEVEVRKVDEPNP